MHPGGVHGSVSVLVPAFNEADNLAPAVRGVCGVLETHFRDYEIIVVDDGSTDGSGQVCRDLQATHRYVRVVRHPRNRGYGAAVRSGILACTGDLIVLFPADRQFDPEDIPALVDLALVHDVVVGRRVRRADPWYRRLMAAGWSWLIRRLFHLRVRDINSGFKVYRRPVLEGRALKANGALIDAEILAGITRQGLSIEEVPVRHFPRTRGRPTGGRPSVIARSFWELCALYGHLRGGAR